MSNRDQGLNFQDQYPGLPDQNPGSVSDCPCYPEPCVILGALGPSGRCLVAEERRQLWIQMPPTGSENSCRRKELEADKHTAGRWQRLFASEKKSFHRGYFLSPLCSSAGIADPECTRELNYFWDVFTLGQDALKNAAILFSALGFYCPCTKKSCIPTRHGKPHASYQRIRVEILFSSSQ